MKIPMTVGIDAKGQPLTVLVHPFLVGARRKELRIPESFATSKTKVMREGFRVIPREAQIRALNKTQAREIARYEKRSVHA